MLILLAAVLVVAAVILWRSAGQNPNRAEDTGRATGVAETAEHGGESRDSRRPHQRTGAAGSGSTVRGAPPSLAAEAGPPPDGGAAPELPSDGSTTMSVRSLEIIDVASDLVDECYELARQRNPDLRGKLEMAVHIRTVDGVGNLVASADLDEDATTVEDKELIQCATENVFAAEEVLDKLKEAGDPTAGRITLQISKQFPPPSKKPVDWPADDSSPVCRDGASLRGELGKSQWCELADGTKHGEQFHWAEGKVQFIQVWEHGESDTMRLRPRGH